MRKAKHHRPTDMTPRTISTRPEALGATPGTKKDQACLQVRPVSWLQMTTFRLVSCPPISMPARITPSSCQHQSDNSVIAISCACNKLHMDDDISMAFRYCSRTTPISSQIFALMLEHFLDSKCSRPKAHFTVRQQASVSMAAYKISLAPGNFVVARRRKGSDSQLSRHAADFRCPPLPDTRSSRGF